LDGRPAGQVDHQGEGDDFDASLDRLLFDLTSTFLAEVGSDVQQFTGGRVTDKPELGNKAWCREEVIELIVRPRDPEMVTKQSSYNPPPG